MGFRSPQLILREAPGSYDSSTGLYAPGARTHFTVPASVQPLSAADMQTMPEGRESRGMVKMYTSKELQVATKQVEAGDEMKQPDRLVWRGNVYELSDSDPYQSNVISHFRYRFRLLGPLSVPPSDVGSIWDNGGSIWDGGATLWDKN